MKASRNSKKSNGSGVKRANGTGRNGARPVPFRVGRSRTGLGLFAVAPIRKGKFIIEYWGKRVLWEKANLYSKYLFDVDDDRWALDGSDRRNTARYINHSCRPNAEARMVRGEIRIHAIKNIQPGDEITYDYGREYFDDIISPIGCKCAACLEKRKGRRKKAIPAKAAKAERGKAL
jgi:SET domain-containing protein